MIDRSVSTWIYLVVLTALIAVAEFFALLYRPTHVWIVAIVLTVLMYALAFLRHGSAFLLGAAVSIGLALLLAWPLMVMGLTRSGGDTAPALLFSLLYLCFFTGAGQMVFYLGRRIRRA